MTPKYSSDTLLYCMQIFHILLLIIIVVYDLGVLKHSAPWYIFWSGPIVTFWAQNSQRFLNYIKSLCVKNSRHLQRFLNYTKWENDSSKLYTLKVRPKKNRFNLFFPIFWHAKIHHLLGCRAIGINSSLIFLKCFTFFKFNMPSPINTL